jgi:hypothetical protein
MKPYQIDWKYGVQESCDKFEREMKHTISEIGGGIKELIIRVKAELELHPEYRVRVDHEIKMHNCGARNSTIVKEEQYRLLCYAFFQILDRNGFDLPNGLSDEANEELRRLLQVIDVLPKDPVPLSAEEQLRFEVLADFSGVYEDRVNDRGKTIRVQVKAPLRAEEFRRKCNNNAAYRKTYEQLASTDAITSSITAHVDGANFIGDLI